MDIVKINLKIFYISAPSDVPQAFISHIKATADDISYLYSIYFMVVNDPIFGVISGIISSFLGPYYLSI